MKRYIVLLLLVAVATATFGKSVLLSDDVTPNLGDPCPCSDLLPGYYYVDSNYYYKPVLLSNMALDEFVGYVIMDSILAHSHKTYTSSKMQNEFIAGLTCNGDTLGYAMRYMYRMADGNPFLYYNFYHSQQLGKQNALPLMTKFYDHIEKECGHHKLEVMKAEYILHLRTTKVENFDCTSDPRVNLKGVTKIDTTKLIFVYNQVLESIKGRVLPNNSKGIEIFRQDSADVSVKKSISLSVPPNTDFIYNYNPGWVNSSVNGKMHQSMWKIPMYENTEYIVFLRHTNYCQNPQHQYYDTRPTTLNYQGGIFPVVNGNVIDEANDWGWGTEVPIQEFKQNLQEIIDSIKNFGD